MLLWKDICPITVICTVLVLGFYVSSVLEWNVGCFSDDAFNLDYGAYLEVQDLSEHYIDVPFYYQEKSYYCGPAALQMVFDYYGEYVSQTEIAEVARTAPYRTYTDELRRAAHFSNLSTSMGSEMEGNITGYTARKLGYASFEISALTINGLKRLIAQDFPLILLMSMYPGPSFGHYRVAVGYNETHIFLLDPLYRLQVVDYEDFLSMWDYSGHWALFVSPWKVTIDVPKDVYVGQQFVVKANITYVSPITYLGLNDSYPIYDYPASSCNATIILPKGLVLLQNETATKMLGSLNGGAATQVSWKVQATKPGNYSIIVTAKGTISGFVGEKLGVGPSYNYEDIIGGSATSFIVIENDETAPLIFGLSQSPEPNRVPPYQNVTVSVSAGDEGSGVGGGILFYSINGSKWSNVSMELISTDCGVIFLKALIPGFSAGTEVKYWIKIWDRAGNVAITDNAGRYYTYTIIPEFSTYTIVFLFFALILLTVLFRRKWQVRQLK